jgi:hypothetical protein
MLLLFPYTQRTTSSGSFGSLDSNSIPDSTSEQQPVQLVSGSQQLVTSPTSQRPPLSSNQVGTRPALVRSATSFNQVPAQQTAASIADTSIDLFAEFNEQNATELNKTFSAGTVVTSSTGHGFIRPATSLNQPSTQQSAGSIPSDTSVDLFAGFTGHNATGLNRTVSDGLTVISPTGPAFVQSATSFNQPPAQRPATSNPSDTYVDLFSGFSEQNTTVLHRTVSAGPVMTSPTEVGPTSTSLDLFAGFDNQPNMEVKDEGWANFDFSQQKQVVANTSLQSSPMETSGGNDLTRGMHPLIGQVPVKNANALPEDPQTVAKALPVNQDRYQVS